MKRIALSWLSLVLFGVATTGCPAPQDFNADDGGFASGAGPGGPPRGAWVWSPTASVDGSGAWSTPGPGDPCAAPSSVVLVSPPLVVPLAGEVSVSFDHRYSFEVNGLPFDGGQLQLSVNGGAFTPPST